MTYPGGSRSNGVRDGATVGSAAPSRPDITPRQREYLVALLDRTYAEAAVELGVTVQTVRKTVADIALRLDLMPGTQKAIYRTLGWLQVPS